MKANILSSILITGALLAGSLNSGDAAQKQGSAGSGKAKGSSPPASGQPPKGTSGSEPKPSERERVQVSEEQRNQLRTCDRSCVPVLERAQVMVQTIQRTGFKAETAKAQCEQLRLALQTMLQNHERVLQGLSAGQRAQVQKSLQQMERERSRMEKGWNAMETELKKPLPNAARVQSHNEEIQQAVQRWREQLRSAGTALGADLSSA